MAQEIEGLTADLMAAKSALISAMTTSGAAIEARDEMLGKLSTAYAEVGAFRRQRDDLVRLVDRTVMPRYVELYEAAGLGNPADSVALQDVMKALAPYREALERRAEREGATP
jgi:hypothetical protein